MAPVDEERLSIPVTTPRDAASPSLGDPDRPAPWVSAVESPAVPLGARRRRREILTITTVGALALLPWIAFLSVTLPQRYATDGWRAAWVGFDVALVAALAATAWCTLKRRQVVVMVMF